MRVISGKAKGQKLKMVPGETTRPITDRVKENLFNILGDWVGGTRWLDLFAGTGQVGIEALSRDAVKVVFVDNARQAVKTISENLKRTKLLDKADVIQADAFNYLQQFSGETFDVIYIAPPQYHKLWVQAIMEIDISPDCYLSYDGMVIIQIDPKEFESIELKTLALFDNRRYGNTMLLFFEVPYSSTNSMAH